MQPLSVDEAKDDEWKDHDAKEQKLQQINAEHQRLMNLVKANKAEHANAFAELYRTKISQRHRERQHAATEIKLLPYACMIVGILWFAGFMIASIAITYNEVYPADKLGERLKPANCTLNNALLPYNDECGHSPSTKYYCIVVSLNFTVDWNGYKWIKEFKMTWPMADAIRITENFNTLFRPGDVRQCFTDGMDLEMYIPNVEGKRALAYNLMIISFIGASAFVIGLLLYCYKKHKCDPAHNYNRLPV